MRIKKIQIENLRSYEKQEINFPGGSTLLSGDIGTGKTSILLAIEFALFGLQPSQKGTSLLRTGTENLRVILEFEIEGNNIVIERTLKRGKSITQDYASIRINDEKFEGSVTEVKNKILKILEYPAEFSKKTNLLYKFTVYTPQEEMKQIILEPKDIRLNTLRHVFGIDKYKRIEENAVLLTSKLREKVRINEGMFLELDSNKESLKQKQDTLINLNEILKKAEEDYGKKVALRVNREKSLQEVQEKINEKKNLENEMSKSSLMISERKQQITTLNNSIKSLVLQIEEAKKIDFNKEDFDALNKRIELQESKHDELQKEYINVLTGIKTQESKKREIEELKNKISRLQKCPTCLQEVGEDYKGVIFRKVDEEARESQKNISELNTRKIQLNEKLESVKNALEEFKKQRSESEVLKIKSENLKEKQQRILEIEEQKSLLQKDLEILEKLMIQLEISIKEYSIYEQTFNDVKQEADRAKREENESAIKKAEINKEIQFSQQQIFELEKQIKQKENLKAATEKIRELEYWISEKFLGLVLFTERQVMFTLKEEFSKLFSKWFSILVSEDLSAKLDDNFSPIIEQQDYELDYSFLSGGERTAVALAYRLSLNQVINSLLSKIKTRNLVILDEPTDGFSSQQLDKMRDVLSQLQTEQLIIVSHEQKIENFVDNIIKFTKEAGITKVENPQS